MGHDGMTVIGAIRNSLLYRVGDRCREYEACWDNSDRCN